MNEILKKCWTLLQINQRLWKKNQNNLIGVGVSCPGPLDSVNGKILNTPNLKILQNLLVKEKQQKILSRLLDSQKSLKERDYSNKRKSETGQEKSYSGPLDLPKNLGNENLIYIDAMEEALNQNYSLEYEKMFRKYYRNLQKSF